MVLYFDCFSGISGDMTVGALIDIGVPEEYLIEELKMLGIDDEYELIISKQVKNGIQGTDFDVILKEHHHDDHDHHSHGRNLRDIEELIDKSKLNDNVKEISKKIFMLIAEAEAKVHGMGLYEVHFHEVGAVDSIVDIVGAAICIDYLKPTKIIASPINTGKGFVRCQHGLIPVPAPATCEILKGVPIYSDEREMELTTPTGAAILKALASEFKELKGLKINRVGYGCGKRNTEKPNLVRVSLCEGNEDTISILEATIDDMNPEFYSFLMDKLFDAGALDVYFTPVYMKKNRPGIVVTITTPELNLDRVKETLFIESTTIGVRKYDVERWILDREIKTLNTSYGEVKFKVGKLDGKIINISPEFEDVRRVANEHNLPIKGVYNQILAQIMKEFLI